jgi:hypothetical protein
VTELLFYFFFVLEVQYFCWRRSNIRFAHSFDVRYIVAKMSNAWIVEDNEYKKIIFKLNVPHDFGSGFASGALKKTQELTFNLFLDQPNCSKILVYESG